MPDFANAKIYKLVNNIDDKIYVGSTCKTLSQRKSKHKFISKIYHENKVYKHLNQVGWENVEIELIENFECESKEELHKRERYWVETLKPDLNTYIPITSSEEKEAYYKDYSREYREKHKEESKQYRDLNREKFTKKNTCSCGGKYTHKNKARHIKTKKHLNYIETKNISTDT